MVLLDVLLCSLSFVWWRKPVLPRWNIHDRFNNTWWKYQYYYKTESTSLHTKFFYGFHNSLKIFYADWNGRQFYLFPIASHNLKVECFLLLSLVAWYKRTHTSTTKHEAWEKAHKSFCVLGFVKSGKTGDT